MRDLTANPIAPRSASLVKQPDNSTNPIPVNTQTKQLTDLTTRASIKADYRFLAIAITVLALAGFMTSAVSAATYFWDGGTVNIGTAGNAASGGTSGTWNTTLQNWDQSPSGSE